MDEQDHKLDKLLAQRHMPQAPDHLAERIIAQARRTKPAYKNLWDDLRDFFVIPHPEFVMAACLLLGLVFGIGWDVSSVTTTDVIWENSLVIEEEWL